MANQTNMDHDAHDAVDVPSGSAFHAAAISIYGSRRPCSAPCRIISTKHYRKVYEEEDAVRRSRPSAAPKRRKSASALCAGKQNPDGITDNVSKKKIRQQESELRKRRCQRLFGEVKKNPVPESEVAASGDYLGDAIKPLLKTATASFGITALNELQQLHNKNLWLKTDSLLGVMEHINKR